MASVNLGVLFIVGIAIFGGITGAWLFERLHFPNVVGYIVIGLVFGSSGFGLIQPQDIARFDALNLFALGLIGFLVGGELQADTFRKYGKQFFVILFGEGLAAFALVAFTTGGIVYAVTGDLRAAVASGVVFGAIASATDPASTVDVLWQYRARGMVTTSLIAIVALDDALAMTLYGIGTSAAQLITGGDSHLAVELLNLLRELGGACLLGSVSALLLKTMLHWFRGHERSLALCLGILFIVVSLADAFNMDVILATMSMGVVLVNVDPRRSKELFTTARGFSTPIYVMFFVLVGARLTLGSMPLWLWAIVGAYVIGRSAGKLIGAYWGARVSHADRNVQQYCGVGLMAQAGVAVGLSLMAGRHLQDIEVVSGLSLGDMIISAVTATTFIVQLAGPPLVKVAIRLAGEIGRNVTEEDVIQSWTVSHVMRRQFQTIPENMPLSGVFRLFADNDHLVYPVVSGDNQIAGLIYLENLKEVIGNQDMWEWLVAGDVKVSVDQRIQADTPLADALESMRVLGVEELPVIQGTDNESPVGLLDMRATKRAIKEETLRRQQAIGKVSTEAASA